ncbi:LysR family transcriptional regulator [Amycolatopsis taiwanensis]|uniref:LysR family transcriptional regulator n=1 Tax=Amycolatopsis taiwanensis TaxID=342230 RepID=A0A9W6QY68_9PSEU|nr:LysR family transcriptional regulator [Amycolatopsis taiwanensis]GLY64217.1 LysR family transcriptional regulator [Amycolatopsis taiwanensis]
MTGIGSKFTLRQLEYLVTVADEGTLAAAAGRHHISQSAISLAITELERALGVQLLMRRKARGIELTQAARQVLPEIRNLLAHAGEVRSSARSLGQSLSGDLVIGCFPTLTPFLMPEILRHFPARHPGVTVRLFEGSMAEVQGRLLDGTCEIAVVYDLAIGIDITTHVLYQVRPYVLLSADHRLAGPEPISLADLRDEPMVMLDMPPSAAMFREVLAVGGIEPNVRFTTTHFESVRSLVASGAGYSLLLQRPAPDTTYAGPPLVYREIIEEVRTVDVVLAHARDARLTRRAHAFADFCRATFTRGRPGCPGPR